MNFLCLKNRPRFSESVTCGILDLHWTKWFFLFQGTAAYLPEDYCRDRQLTDGVDIFCYGLFLFELVTGKSPSFIPSMIGLRMRDIMLTCIDPEEWFDPACQEASTWPLYLFLIGRDCTQSNRRKRAKMAKVFTSLEKLHNSPMMLTLQSYYDATSSEVPVARSITVAPSLLKLMKF